MIVPDCLYGRYPTIWVYKILLNYFPLISQVAFQINKRFYTKRNIQILDMIYTNEIMTLEKLQQSLNILKISHISFRGLKKSIGKLVGHNFKYYRKYRNIIVLTDLNIVCKVHHSDSIQKYFAKKGSVN